MRFIDSTLVLLTTHSIGLVITFLVSVMVSRTLGPSGKGTFSLLLGLATILFGISNLGMGFASQYFISRDRQSANLYFSNAMWFPLFAAIITVALFVGTYPLWQSQLQDLQVTDLLPVFAMLPLMLIFESQCQILVVLSEIKRRSVAILTQGAVLLVGAGILLFLGAGPITASYSYAMGWLCGGIVTFCAVTSVVGRPRRPSLSLFKVTMRYGVWVWLANMIKGVFLRTDFLILYSLRSAGEAGIYSVALALTSGLTVAFQAVVTVFHPKTSAMSDRDAIATTPKYYKGMMLLMIGFGAITAILAYPLLSIFGDEFLRGHIPMLILVVAIGVSGVNAILTVHMLGRGKPYVMTIMALVTLATAISLNRILVPDFGILGAASATLGVYLIENVVLTVIYKKAFGGDVIELYRPRREDIRSIVGELRSALGRLGRPFDSNA